MARDNLPDFARIVAENFGKTVDTGLILNAAKGLKDVTLASADASNNVTGVKQNEPGLIR